MFCIAMLGIANLTAAAERLLQICRISPSGVDVQPGQEIVLQFDRPMVTLGNMARPASRLPISIARRYGGRKRNFAGDAFWARGYFVSTVGLDEAMVRAYIRNQEKEDERYDPMKRGV